MRYAICNTDIIPALTLGGEYQIISESNSHLTVLNDMDRERPYAKKYFTILKPVLLKNN